MRLYKPAPPAKKWGCGRPPAPRLHGCLMITVVIVVAVQKKSKYFCTNSFAPAFEPLKRQLNGICAIIFSSTAVVNKFNT